MIRYLLDTDTVTFWLQGHEAVTSAVVARPMDEIAIPVIVVEEIWDGWQAVIRAAKTPERLAFGYERLTRAMSQLRPFQVVTFTAPAIERHVVLKRLKLNVGTNDLKIAATARDLDATVVINNESDFRRVPGLRVENWTLPLTPTS